MTTRRYTYERITARQLAERPALSTLVWCAPIDIASGSPASAHSKRAFGNSEHDPEGG